MDADLKAKWVEALRSGKYAQTTRTLKDERGYCCLGVLCAVAGNDPQFSYYGISQTLGVSDRQQDTLMSMNDEERKTFAEIADEIEKTL